ncbi:MAG TPA: protease inhibitor I42 family protein [Anaerolineales bacterium]|nr:protease inhibitor I42 family protein [Anaerolineales bacterium]
MRRICVFLIVTILLTGCVSASPTPTPTLPPTAEPTSSLPEPTDFTQLITVKAGETFDLVVPSNPSTGYRWDLIPELDETRIEFVAQDYIAEEPVIPGSGGVDVWTFRALTPGDTTVVLGYYPPGDQTDPEEAVTFSIHAE